MSRDYTIQNINNKLKRYLKVTPRYKDLSMNKGSERLADDLFTGKLISKDSMPSMNEIIHGKKKKGSL